jgi:hypothetical protein
VSSSPSTPENTVISQENYSDLTDENERQKTPRFSSILSERYSVNEVSTNTIDESLCDNIQKSSSEESVESVESGESEEEILLDLCLNSGNGNYETYVENREPSTSIEIAENITI